MEVNKTYIFYLLYILGNKYLLMFRSRVAVLEGHNKNAKTDQLYEPLRKAFHLDTTRLKNQLEEVSHASHISHFVKTHTFEESLRLGEQTYIPEDVRLRPTHNTWKIGKDHTYYIINAQQKVHTPISQQEMDRILRNQHSEEVIVYTMEDEANYQKDQRIDQLWTKITHENHITDNRVGANNVDYSTKTFTFQNSIPTQMNSINSDTLNYQVGSDKRDTYTIGQNYHFNDTNFGQTYLPTQQVTANMQVPKITVEEQISSNTYKNDDSIYNSVRNTIKPHLDATNKGIYATPVTQENSQYKYQNDQSTVIDGNTKKIQQTDINPEESRKTQYVAKNVKPIQRKSSGILLTQKPKYNLFSAIDEPINNILSGKACSCPANTIIAEQMNEISWYNTLRHQ